jgi:hypothetical protein
MGLSYRARYQRLGWRYIVGKDGSSRFVWPAFWFVLAS